MKTRMARLNAFHACWMLILLAGQPLEAQQSAQKALFEPAIHKPIVGNPHPDFQLPNIVDGKPVRLSDFRGTKVLLVHFASW